MIMHILVFPLEYLWFADDKYICEDFNYNWVSDKRNRSIGQEWQ